MVFPETDKLEQQTQQAWKATSTLSICQFGYLTFDF